MSIYSAVKVCGGEIILKIKQIEDFGKKIGKGKGKCFGYALQFAEGFLTDGKPFGVDQNNPPQQSPVKDNAVLQKSISIFQSHKNSFYYSRYYYFHKSKTQVRARLESASRPYLHIEKLAKKLIKIADNEPSKVYIIGIHGLDDGHAVAFSKDKKGNYHFFDSNAGWFRFDNSSGFIKYLPFFISKMNYDNERLYEIVSAEIKKPMALKDLKSATKILFQYFLLTMPAIILIVLMSLPIIYFIIPLLLTVNNLYLFCFISLLASALSILFVNFLHSSLFKIPKILSIFLPSKEPYDRTLDSEIMANNNSLRTAEVQNEQKKEESRQPLLGDPSTIVNHHPIESVQSDIKKEASNAENNDKKLGEGGLVKVTGHEKLEKSNEGTLEGSREIEPTKETKQENNGYASPISQGNLVAKSESNILKNATLHSKDSTNKSASSKETPSAPST